MFIESITLIDYRPFLLRGIKKVYLKFSSIYQLIIGTNNSGKSSLLRQLTPLPAVASDFATGGSKEIIISHMRNTFRLLSTFTDKGPKHFFYINDGDNVNNGFTLTGQKQLVEEFFGIKSDIFDILLGSTTFTSMTPLQRRDILLNISKMNLDYAMEVYDKLKIKNRESIQLLKHFRKRFDEVHSSLPSKEVIIEIENKVNKLNQEFLDLHVSKFKDVDGLEATKNALLDLDNTIKTMLTKVQTMSYTTVSKKEFLTNAVGELQLLISNRESRKKEVISSLNKLLEEKEELKNILNDVRKALQFGDTDLCHRRDELQSNYDSLKTSFNIKEEDVKNSEAIAIAFTSIMDDVVDILSTIPPNVNGIYNRQQVIDSQEELSKLRSQVANLKITIDKASHFLEHVETSEKTKCPKCEHTWVVGLDEATILTTIHKLEQAKATIGLSSARIEELEKYLEKSEEYFSCIRRLNRHSKSTPILKTLWNDIADNWDAAANIPAALQTVSNFTLYKNALITMNNIKVELMQIEEALKVINSDKMLTYNLAVDKDVIVAEQIEEHIATVEFITSEVKEINKIISARQNADNINNKLTSAMSSYCKVAENIDKCLFNATIDNTIETVRTELSKLVIDLNDAKNSTAVLDKIKEELQSAQIEHDTSKLLSKLLSPVDGLIAEQLQLFINNFVSQINYVISKVWTHDFYLLPPSKENGIEESVKLDYIFPMKIKAGVFPIKDISIGSSSQIDIINFAFRLVVMLYLNLSDYPLYLDELAPSLDETHRAKIIAFVKEYIEAKQCSQMFMISHYVTNHGGFTHAEVCVTDDTNIITLPKIYNKHVVFE